MIIPKVLQEKIVQLPGDVYLTGGAVRDHLLGKSTEDFDFEIFGVDSFTLAQVVQNMFPEAKITGNDFAVLSVRYLGYDLQFSIPRTERKVGTGYKGFEIYSDPNMSVFNAAQRRDLTINAVYYNIKTDEFSDPVGGISDLHAKLLCPVSERFKEDPIRIFRVAYFAMQDKDYKIASELNRYAYELQPELSAIHQDKIKQIFFKMAQKAVAPSNGLNFLLENFWLDFIDALATLPYVPQNPLYHPEGNVWQHTMQVMDYFCGNSKTILTDSEKVIGFFGTLLHDVGKLWTTEVSEKDGKLHAYGHEAKSSEAVTKLLQSIDPNFDKDVIRQVKELCLMHMYLHQPATLKNVRNVHFTLQENSFQLLWELCQADQLSRIGANGVRPADYEKSKENLRNWKRTYDKIRSETIIITGDDLIAVGLKPGPKFKKLLEQALRWQCSGYLNEMNKEQRLKELVNLQSKGKTE